MIGKIKERGITLIALVVTIIILLILAGVTLNIALSENGLLGKAKESAESYKTAQQNEIDELTRLEKQLGTPPTTIQEAKDNEYEFMDTTRISDKKGNKIVIPKDFHIASESGDTVQQGIVIEDSNENQFVWIPVSNINGDNIKNGNENDEDLIILDNDSKIEITLGRYNFVETIVEKNDNNQYGDPILVQKGSECSSDDDAYKIWLYKENTMNQRLDGGKGAKDLGKFVESVEKNHGYYFARYEAVEGTDSKPISKSGKSWTNITQPEASEAAQKMYGENGNYTSDLVNSYAWDTAIVYIQAMGNINYAGANRGENTELEDTGKTGDEKCHIFDMAGNIHEWSTECRIKAENSEKIYYVTRGGDYNVDTYITGIRNGSSGNSENVGFRVVLYL